MSNLENFNFTFKDSSRVKKASANIDEKLKNTDFTSEMDTSFSKMASKFDNDKYDEVREKNKDSEEMEKFLRGLHGAAHWKF